MLNCFVLGGDPNRVFEIKIAPTESVSALKKAIKEEKKQTFRDVDADTLQLWKVSDLIPTISHIDADDLVIGKVNINLKKGVLKNIKTKPDIEGQDREELEDTWTLLSEIFTREPQSDHLHIIVPFPPQSRCDHFQMLAKLTTAPQRAPVVFRNCHLRTSIIGQCSSV